MALAIPFLSICPRIASDKDTLVASTGWTLRLLLFGLWLRRITVERSTQTITIDRRIGWFFSKRQTFTFGQIIGVTYGYEDASFGPSFESTHDSTDVFLVGLLLPGREEIVLFKFIGDGTFTNDGPLPDWWYWEEYAADWSGTQAQESRLFVQLISKIIGVTIVPSTLTRDEM